MTVRTLFVTSENYSGVAFIILRGPSKSPDSNRDQFNPRNDADLLYQDDDFECDTFDC